jgi:hypothetical protein
MIYIYIYIYLTVIGLTPGGSCTSHIYTQTIHIIQRKENCEVRAAPRLCELYPGICLTTEKKARKNLSWVAQHSILTIMPLSAKTGSRLRACEVVRMEMRRT